MNRNMKHGGREGRGNRGSVSSAAMFESLEGRRLMSVSPVVGELSHDGGGSSEPHPTPNPPVALLVPLRPSGLSASAADGAKVKLSWSDNSNNESGFAIFRLGKGGLTQVGTVGANVTTFTDTSAPAGTDVYVVRAFNDSGKSEGSNAATITLKPAAPVVPVTAPRKLRSEAVSSSSIKVSWETDTGASGGYRVERSLDGKTGWTTAGTTAKDVRTFTDTGLASGTKYYYRVVVLGAGDQTATSAVLIGMTKRGDQGEPVHAENHH